MDGREWLLLITLALLWGSTFFLTEIALLALPPLTLVLGRVGLAAVALLALVHLLGRRMPRAPGLWGAFLLMGLLNNVLPFNLIVAAQTERSPAASPRSSTARAPCSACCWRISSPATSA